MPCARCAANPHARIARVGPWPATISVRCVKPGGTERTSLLTPSSHTEESAAPASTPELFRALMTDVASLKLSSGPTATASAAPSFISTTGPEESPARPPYVPSALGWVRSVPWLS